jgi:hypothetical protein
VKPDIDCARLPREAMVVALPRKVDTILLRAAVFVLPRANLEACLAKSERIFVLRQRDFSLLLLFQLRHSCGFDQLQHVVAALQCWMRTRLLTPKQTNECAAHKQLLVAAGLISLQRHFS